MQNSRTLSSNASDGLRPLLGNIFFGGALGLFVLMCMTAFAAPRLIGILVPVIGLFSILGLIFTSSLSTLLEYIKQNRIIFFFCGTWLLLAGLSSLWSVDPSGSMERTLKLTPLILFGLFMPLMISGMSQGQLRRLFLIIVASFLAGMVLLIFDLLSNLTLFRFYRGLSYADWAHPSSLNRAIVFIGLLSCFIVPILCRSFSRWVTGAYMILFLIMLTFTESQSAQLAIAIGLLSYFLFSLTYRPLWIALQIGLCGLILAAPWFALWLAEDVMALAKSHEWLRQGYAAARFEIWGFIGEYILRNPLYGFGIEATRAITDFNAPGIYHDVVALHPHNFALQLWIEFGVLGAALGCAALCWLIEQIRWLEVEPRRAAMACLAATLTIMATGYGLWQSWWIGTFLTLFAVFAITSQLAESEVTGTRKRECETA